MRLNTNLYGSEVLSELINILLIYPFFISILISLNYWILSLRSVFHDTMNIQFVASCLAEFQRNYQLVLVQVRLVIFLVFILVIIFCLLFLKLIFLLVDLVSLVELLEFWCQWAFRIIIKINFFILQGNIPFLNAIISHCFSSRNSAADFTSFLL